MIKSQRNRNILTDAGSMFANIQYSFLIKEILVNSYIYTLEANFLFNSEILRAYPLNTGINTYLML